MNMAEFLESVVLFLDAFQFIGIQRLDAGIGCRRGARTSSLPVPPDYSCFEVNEVNISG
jgi:hypothetical protein